MIEHGYKVRIMTAHHDPKRCFSETKPGAILGDKVSVHGNWLPRTVFGRLHVVCAVVRMMWVSLVISFMSIIGLGPDLIICDQVSHVVPLLRWGTGKRVIFYCHFPDKLLCVDRSSWLKRTYRAPIDWWEESSTGASDAVVVNSKFTGQVFRQSFTRLHDVQLRVLYPSIDFKQFDQPLDAASRRKATETLPKSYLQHLQKHGDASILLVSINRFERKKNLLLAVKALVELKASGVASALYDRVHLMLAGGYDPRLNENVAYMQELVELVADQGLEDKVSFLRSFSDEQRLLLMETARCVLYTPDQEHFGIVPIEAMYKQRPVIALASGGPLETVIDSETGFLVPPNDAKSFALATRRLVENDALAKEMGHKARAHVSKHFSLQAFGDQLDVILQEYHRKGAAESFYARAARIFVFLFLVVCLLDASYNARNKMMLTWLWSSIPTQWFREFANYLG